MGVNYWETYSPVVNWMSVRAMLALSIVNTKEQITDTFMKPLDSELFGYIRYKINGW